MGHCTRHSERGVTPGPVFLWSHYRKKARAMIDSRGPLLFRLAQAITHFRSHKLLAQSRVNLSCDFSHLQQDNARDTCLMTAGYDLW